MIMRFGFRDWGLRSMKYGFDNGFDQCFSGFLSNIAECICSGYSFGTMHSKNN